MRTFHVGGIAGAADITMGLPRVEEIFEMRVPKSLALISSVAGKVIAISELADSATGEKIIKVATDADGIHDFTAPFGKTILVNEGDMVEPGAKLTEGAIDIKDLLTVAGVGAVQNYIISEVQQLY